LIAEVMKWSNENGVRLLNLSSGTDRSKTRWRPDSISTSGGYQYRNSLLGKLALRAVIWLRHQRRAPPQAKTLEPEIQEASSETLGFWAGRRKFTLAAHAVRMAAVCGAAAFFAAKLLK
jgi:hypothetical protein